MEFPLPLQVVQYVDIRGADVTVNHHDNGQAHAHFGGCYRHNKEHKNLGVGIGPVSRKGGE